MSVLAKSDRPVKWIPAKDLSVEWAQSQRPLSVRKVSNIAANLDPDAFGVVAVCPIPKKRNGEVSFHIIDGQHRVAALVECFGASERVPCQVIEGATSPEEAAEVWITMNTERSKPNAYERFTVAVTAGRPVEAAVSEIIAESPFSVGRGSLQAVGSAISAYKVLGGTGLAWVLDVLHDTWGPGGDSVQASLLQGYSLLYEHLGKQLDRDRLVSQVAKRHSANALRGLARSSREIHGGSIGVNVARVVLSDYNKYLRIEDHLRLPGDA